MPKVKCWATWCIHNKEDKEYESGICTSDSIELDWDTYDQFWCNQAKDRRDNNGKNKRI